MAYAAGQDPLCYPGSTVLYNKADLRSQAELDEFETAMFVIRAGEAWPEGDLGVSYYLGLHRHLFQDVYDWAGQFRTIRIAKGGNWFCYPEHISGQLNSLFDWAEGKGWLLGHTHEAFCIDAAHLISELNAIHPFREGNGRTQLAFLSILADSAGYNFNEDVLEPQRVIMAMVESFHGQAGALRNLIDDLTF